MIKSKRFFALMIICLSARLLFFIAVKPWDPFVVNTIILKADALGYHKLATTVVNSHQFAYENNGMDCEPRSIHSSLVYSIQLLAQFRGLFY
jgi:hypothetical protein